MPAKQYKPVRVTVETHEALAGWMTAAVRAADLGQIAPWWDGDEPTVDEAVRELVRRETVHKAREKASRKARQARRAEQPSS